MKLIKKILLILVPLIVLFLWYKHASIENMALFEFDKNNKEYMDMLISVTSIFGGIFVIVVIMALSSPIKNSNIPVAKPYSSRIA